MSMPLPATDTELTERFHQQSDELSQQVRKEFRHELNVAYGQHPRQILDVYYPNASPNDSVLVFFHGGGFRGGDPKSVAFAGRPALESGAIFVSAGYRLLPDAVFPKISDDALAAIEWVQHSVLGNRLVLAGHSVGAILAADIGLRRTTVSNAIAALVLVSGNYVYADLPPFMVDTASERYVPDLSTAIEHIPSFTVVAAGADEQRRNVITESAALADAIRARGGQVENLVLEDIEHLYMAIAMAEAGSQLGKATLRALGAQ